MVPTTHKGHGDPSTLLQTNVSWRDWVPAVAIAAGLFILFMLYTCTIGRRRRNARTARDAAEEQREKDKDKQPELSRQVSLKNPGVQETSHQSGSSTSRSDTTRIDITDLLNTPTRATFGEIESSPPRDGHVGIVESNGPGPEGLPVQHYAISPYVGCTHATADIGRASVPCQFCRDEITIPPRSHRRA